jgi:RNA polymerase sigma-70 factor (ECF subfamily)
MSDTATPHDPAAEAALLERLRAGEDAAFEELVRTHGGRMLAVARRFLRSEDDAQDAVQDAFLSAFKALDRFEGKSRLSTWLHRIVVNASLMKIRRRKRKPETSLEDLQPGYREDGRIADPPEPWVLPADRTAERNEIFRKVRAAIDELPDNYRTVLLLRDIEELDTAETAELLGVTPNAVKIRLHRARLALRERIDPELR